MGASSMAAADVGGALTEFGKLPASVQVAAIFGTTVVICVLVWFAMFALKRTSFKHHGYVISFGERVIDIRHSGESKRMADELQAHPRPPSRELPPQRRYRGSRKRREDQSGD